MTMTKRPSPPSDPSNPRGTATMARDQVVVGLLATRPALPDLTRELLPDALFC